MDIHILSVPYYWGGGRSRSSPFLETRKLWCSFITFISFLCVVKIDTSQWSTEFKAKWFVFSMINNQLTCVNKSFILKFRPSFLSINYYIILSNFFQKLLFTWLYWVLIWIETSENDHKHAKGLRDDYNLKLKIT